MTPTNVVAAWVGSSLQSSLRSLLTHTGGLNVKPNFTAKHLDPGYRLALIAGATLNIFMQEDS